MGRIAVERTGAGRAASGTYFASTADFLRTYVRAGAIDHHRHAMHATIASTPASVHTATCELNQLINAYERKARSATSTSHTPTSARCSGVNSRFFSVTESA